MSRLSRHHALNNENGTGVFRIIRFFLLLKNISVTALLSALFRSTDLVPSDVVAGCVLLRVRQKRETREMRRIQMLNDEEPIYTTDVNKIFSETPPWMNLEDALYYLRLSIAAYGWPYVLYRHCFTGFCKLARHLTCCCCRWVWLFYNY